MVNTQWLQDVTEIIFFSKVLFTLVIQNLNIHYIFQNYFGDSFLLSIFSYFTLSRYETMLRRSFQFSFLLFKFQEVFKFSFRIFAILYLCIYWKMCNKLVLFFLKDLRDKAKLRVRKIFLLKNWFRNILVIHKHIKKVYLWIFNTNLLCSKSGVLSFAVFFVGQPAVQKADKLGKNSGRNRDTL